MAAGQVAAASEQLSASAEELSSGAQEQASSLEETSASLEEITSTRQPALDGPLRGVVHYRDIGHCHLVDIPEFEQDLGIERQLLQRTGHPLRREPLPDDLRQRGVELRNCGVDRIQLIVPISLAQPAKQDMPGDPQEVGFHRGPKRLYALPAQRSSQLDPYLLDKVFNDLDAGLRGEEHP